MEEKNFQTEGGVFAYPNLKPVRFLLNYDPPQLGMMYKRYANEKKKHLFLVQLNKLLLLGDAEKITQALFEKYPAFINESVVSAEKIYNLVNKLLEYIQNLISHIQDGEEEAVLEDEDYETDGMRI